MGSPAGSSSFSSPVTRWAGSSKTTSWGRLARWRLMEQLQDPRCGSTCQPRWRLMRRGRADGLTTYCQLHPKECERDRTNSPGLFLHGHPGGRSKWLVRRLRRVHPLGLGCDCPSAARHPQTHTLDTREALDPQHSTTSCAAYVHSALCNRTMCLIHSCMHAVIHSCATLDHARHAHAQLKHESHHTRLRSRLLFQTWLWTRCSPSSCVSSFRVGTRFPLTYGASLFLFFLSVSLSGSVRDVLWVRAGHSHVLCVMRSWTT